MPTPGRSREKLPERHACKASVPKAATSSRDGTLLETRGYDGANRLVRAQANKDLAISETVNGVTRAWSGGNAKEYFDKLHGSGNGTGGRGLGSDTRTNRYDANGRLLFAAVNTAAGTARYNLDYSKSDGSACCYIPGCAAVPRPALVQRLL